MIDPTAKIPPKIGFSSLRDALDALDLLVGFGALTQAYQAELVDALAETLRSAFAHQADDSVAQAEREEMTGQHIMTDALPRLRAMAEDHAGIEPERIEVLALPRSGQVLITVDQHGRGIDDPCDAVILTAADLANIGAGDGWPGDEPWTWVDIEMALDGSLRALQFVRGDIARLAGPFGRIADALQNGRDTTGAAS